MKIILSVVFGLVIVSGNFMAAAEVSLIVVVIFRFTFNCRIRLASSEGIVVIFGNIVVVAVRIIIIIVLRIVIIVDGMVAAEAPLVVVVIFGVTTNSPRLPVHQ